MLMIYDPFLLNYVHQWYWFSSYLVTLKQISFCSMGCLPQDDWSLHQSWNPSNRVHYRQFFYLLLYCSMNILSLSLSLLRFLVKRVVQKTIICTNQPYTYFQNSSSKVFQRGSNAGFYLIIRVNATDCS